MRVTWTELARTKTKNMGDTQDSKERSGGVRFREADDNVPETAEFSLARQREENNRLLNRGDASNSSSDDEEQAFIEGDGPVTYKSNIARRKTLARAQLLESDSVEKLGVFNKSSSDMSSQKRGYSGLD